MEDRFNARLYRAAYGRPYVVAARILIVVEFSDGAREYHVAEG